MINAVSIGRAASAFVGSQRTALVVGVFGHGFYVRPSAGTEIIAVVDRAVADCPLHLRVDTTAFQAPIVGTSVHIDEETLNVGGLDINLRSAKRYEPTLPPDLGYCAGLLAQLRFEVPSDLETAWPEVLGSIDDGQFETLANLICGRGQGLTPEGDDVLAGLLISLAVNERNRPFLSALVDEARTTDLSRAFMKWAAHGHSIRPVHELLWSAYLGDQVAFEDAERRIRSIGGSTGNAMLAGMTLAAPSEARISDTIGDVFYPKLERGAGSPGRVSC